MMVGSQESVITVSKRLAAVMVREVDHDLLLLDTESDYIHQLNQTASFIWRSCDGASSAEDIAASLAKEYDVEKHVALRDVVETLSSLRALNLVVDA
jgi:hypothetical protein